MEAWAKKAEQNLAGIFAESLDDSELCEQLAKQVVTGLVNYAAGDKKRFRTRYVALVVNLKDKTNGKALVGRLVAKEIMPERLAYCKSEELNPALWGERQEKQQTRDLMKISNSAKLEKEEMIKAGYKGINQCGRCKSWLTTYYEKQTRSADEPMTAFIRCVNCKKRWKQG